MQRQADNRHGACLSSCLHTLQPGERVYALELLGSSSDSLACWPITVLWTLADSAVAPSLPKDSHCSTQKTLFDSCFQRRPWASVM